MKVHRHITRSFSVPVKGKATASLRVTDSRRLIRVISARPHVETVGRISADGVLIPEIGNSSKYMDFTKFYSKCPV